MSDLSAALVFNLGMSEKSFQIKLLICTHLPSRIEHSFDLEVLHSLLFNSLPYMTILDSSNSVANKDMMLKIWTNGDTIF